MWYKVVARISGKCFDIVGGGTTAGTRLVQSTCHGGDNQLFQFQSVGSGLYRIIAGNSGLCIDQANAVYNTGELARVSFWHLFEHHLKPGGLYVIEDWGTGYWDFWDDGVRYRPPRGPAGYSRLRHRLNRAAMRLYNSRLGRLSLVGGLASSAKRVLQRGLYNSHDYGMVGFVKELVDELGMPDITHPDFGIAPPRPSRFREMKLSQSHLIVVKA